MRLKFILYCASVASASVAVAKSKYWIGGFLTVKSVNKILLKHHKAIRNLPKDPNPKKTIDFILHEIGEKNHHELGAILYAKCKAAISNNSIEASEIYLKYYKYIMSID